MSALEIPDGEPRVCSDQPAVGQEAGVLAPVLERHPLRGWFLREVDRLERRAHRTCRTLARRSDQPSGRRLDLVAGLDDDLSQRVLQDAFEGRGGHRLGGREGLGDRVGAQGGEQVAQWGQAQAVFIDEAASDHAVEAAARRLGTLDLAEQRVGFGDGRLIVLVLNEEQHEHGTFVAHEAIVGGAR